MKQREQSDMPPPGRHNFDSQIQEVKEKNKNEEKGNKKPESESIKNN